MMMDGWSCAYVVESILKNISDIHERSCPASVGVVNEKDEEK